VPVSPAYTIFARGSKTARGRYDVVVHDEQENSLARATFVVR